MRGVALWVCCAGCAVALKAQKNIDLDTVVVSAARWEQSLLESQRNVQVLSGTELQNLPAQSVAELLEFIPGIDARQRGMFGTQTDLSIRGGTFEQVLVLVDGVRMGDPQTGHHLMNLPLAKQDIERIEVLLGGGSYIFGANAFSGVINIITKKEAEKNTRLSAAGGSFGSGQMALRHQWAPNNARHSLSLQHSRSAGFRPNTDFTQSSFRSQNHWEIGENQSLALNLGLQAQNFGAQNFYSTAFPQQYEKIRAMLLDLQWKRAGRWQSTGSVYWRRHWDEFQLFREGDDFFQLREGRFITAAQDSAPAWYSDHNYHRSDVAGAKWELLRKSALGKTALAGEYRYEQVRSNNLGDSLGYTRNHFFSERGTYFLGAGRHNLSLAAEHAVERGPWHFNAALQVNYNSAFGLDLFPALHSGYALNKRQKIYWGFNRSFRLPSYTDLYYRLGGAQGSEDLQPENSYNFESGYKWLSSAWFFNLSIFHRAGRQIIDWTQTCDTCLLLATNTQVADFWGGEWQGRYQMDWAGFQFVELGYNYLFAERPPADAPRSLYLFDYLRHKITLRSIQQFGRYLSMSYALSYQHRKGTFFDLRQGQRVAYPQVFLLNLRLSYTRAAWEIYAQAQNLTDQRYFDRGNVELPGRWLWLGGSFNF